MTDLDFSAGTAVEVNIDSDNSRDEWFPATFVKQVTNNYFLVEYQRSREAGLQKVTVDSLHIRPAPPRLIIDAFHLLEKVDAFCDFCWLSGVVTKIIADERYVVYFKHTKKEKELRHADLRFHMEWINGQWVYPSQDTSMISNPGKQSGDAVNGGYKEKVHAPSESSGAAIDEGRISNVTPGSGKATPSNKRIKLTSAISDDIHSRPSKRSNDETTSDGHVSLEACKSKTRHKETTINGTPSDLDTSTSSQPGNDSFRQSEGGNQPSAPEGVEADHEKHPSRRKRGRPRKLQVMLSDAVEQIPKKSPIVQPFKTIVDETVTDKLAEISGQQEPKKAMEDEEKLCDASAYHESVGSDQQKDGEVPSLRRKRGRPPKVLFRVGRSKTKGEFVEKEGKSIVPDAKDTAERRSPTNEVVNTAAVFKISDSTSGGARRRRAKIVSNTLRRTGRRQRKILKETVLAGVNELAKPSTLRRGRTQKSTKQVEPPTEDAVDNSRVRADEVVNNGVARDVVATGVAGTSSNVSDDDRPLSAWFEGAHSSPTTDGKVHPDETAGRCDETRERREPNKTQPVGQHTENADGKRDENTPAENVNGAPERSDEMPIQSTAIVTMDDQGLPFVKSSLIWEMIESMEVLKRIPQKPHFRPLYDSKEERREGLAIGSMVTFTSLVEKISRFQFGDSQSLLVGYLEALVELEELGFNVVPVREKLNTMLSIVSRNEQAHNTSKEIQSQITERNIEKSKIDEEIADLDKQIAELNEKRTLAMSKKDGKEAEIALLQSSVDTVKGSLESARVEFEKVIASFR